MQMDHIGDLIATHQRAQHRHHRCDARAGGEEQHGGRGRIRQYEIALRQSQSHDRAGLHPVHQVSGQEAFGHRLDGDGHRARTSLWTGCQRVRAPPPSAVDQQPDAHVLTRLVVEAETPARLDDQRRRVARLAPHLKNAAPQFPRRPQRIGKAQVVIGQQRRGDASGKGAQRVPAWMGFHSGQRNGPGFDDVGGGSRYFSVH